MGACRRCSGHPPAPALADHAGPLAAQYHFDEKITNDAGDSTPDSSGHAFGAFTTRIAALAESPTLKRASWLNGSSSSAASGRTITKYEWDFNADGVYDAQCGADAPAVSRPFSKSGAVKVALRVTDTAGVSAVTDERLVVTSAATNQWKTDVFTCEKPREGNQANQPGCVKAFAFRINESNARSSRCFAVDASIPVSLASAQLRRPSPSLCYVATVEGPVALNGLSAPLPGGRESRYDDCAGKVSLGRVPLVISLPGGKRIQLAAVDLTTKVPSRKSFEASRAPLRAPSRSVPRIRQASSSTRCDSRFRRPFSGRCESRTSCSSTRA